MSESEGYRLAAGEPEGGHCLYFWFHLRVSFTDLWVAFTNCRELIIMMMLICLYPQIRERNPKVEQNPPAYNSDTEKRHWG